MRVLLPPFKLLNQSSALLSNWIINSWFGGLLAKEGIKGSYVCRPYRLGALSVVRKLRLDPFEALAKRLHFLIEPSLIVLLVSQHSLKNVPTFRRILILRLW